MAGQRYRPQPARVIAVSVALLAAPVLAFAWSGPLYIKVIGVVAGCCAPVYLYASARTFIEIDEETVTMRGVRGAAVAFTPDDVSLKITQAASGLTSLAPVVTLRRSDGRYAATPLASFSRRDRRAIPLRLHAVLSRR